MMRDFRINLIFEGASEIMRLFIAREAVDKHFALAFPIVSPDSTMKQRVAALSKSAPFYATWYPARWLSPLVPASFAEFGALATHLRFARRATNRLGRAIFHAMVRFGPALEKRQLVLFRAVEIGAELYAMSASCVRAQMLAKKGEPGGISLADAFCREARVRIERNFDRLFGPDDAAIYRLASEVLKGQHRWLEQGAVSYESNREAGRGAPRPSAPEVPVGIH
jgi:hypothetical protein